MVVELGGSGGTELRGKLTLLEGGRGTAEDKKGLAQVVLHPVDKEVECRAEASKVPVLVG